MPQLTNETGLQKFVDSDRVLFGEKGPKDLVNFEVKWKQSESSIEYIETTCSCIKGWYEKGVIRGTLDLGKVQKEPYSKGQTSVGKTVTIMINDGINRFTADGVKRKTLHPLKKWVTLQVTGVVVV